MSKIVKTWDGHQGELLYIKGKIAFIKESNGEVWFCLKTDIIDFDEINMEEYYVKDAGKITYNYGVDLEEHIRVIEKLQHQLEEKNKQLAEKDIRIEELEGQFAYECECNMQLVDLQKQLEEKKNTIDEINKEFVQAVHDWKALCAKKDNEISKLQASYQQVKTQLAIQELEKVKNFVDGRTYCANYIKKRIKELKGEKDVED